MALEEDLAALRHRFEDGAPHPINRTRWTRARRPTRRPLESNDVLAALRRNSWFRNLPPAVVQQLVPALNLRRYGADELVHAKHETANRLYCVISGGLRASCVSWEGHESILAFWGVGAWIGLGGLLDGQTRALDITTCQETVLATLSRRDLNELLDDHPVLYKHFALQMCDVARSAFATFEDQSVLPVQARLAKRLVALADTYGTPHQDGILIELHLPQQALASIFHVSRATVNKKLVEWRRRSWIEMHYGKIIVRKREALEQLFMRG